MERHEKVNYQEFAQQSMEQMFKAFNSTADGLTEELISDSRSKYGANKLTEKKRTPYIVEIFHAYITPFTLVLLALGLISYFTDYLFAPPADRDLIGVIIIFFMVFLSGTMTLIQSIKSNQAVDQLKKLVKVSTTVIRNHQEQEIAINEVVCGDIIKLSAGDMIPADVRLMKTKDLFVSQAAMTGESYPVEKFAASINETLDSETEYNNLLFMGSNVISGTGSGIVVSVGDDTLFGKIAQQMTEKPEKTNFEIGISKTSWLLIRFMLLMAPAVFVINGFTKGNWLAAALFGLSVAVGLTPEMLPMIVTTNLVKGASTMAKKGTIIKNLNAIQNFGAIDVLCTDKTGTLTQDKIVLEFHLDCTGNEDNRVLRHAFFNSYFQTGLKNLLDVAIIDAAKKELQIPVESYQKVDEIPFDFQRRRMSVVIQDDKKKCQMITKGAIEEMLAISAFVDFDGEIKPLTEETKEFVLKKVQELNERGMRVLGVAQKTNPSVVGEFSVSDENEMVLIGYLAFLDPPKPTTKKALEALEEHGVHVKVLTGDNEPVTRAICQQVDLACEEVITGGMVENASDADLVTMAEKYDIFVKLSPQQKSRLVAALRQNGHTVGFMGDGINDAPAMKKADVGISVDTAVDIAKESADVILLKKDLMVLERGILAGRTTFGNIMKYIKMTASSNFGNMFSVLCASIFLPFLPMMPLQLLFLNLVYDISCMSIPWDKMDSEYLEKPKKWNAGNIGSFMRWIGPTSSIFDITTYLVMYFVICPQVVGGTYHTLDAKHQALFIAIFNAGWFVESLWTQTLVIHNLRTPKIAFLQSNASIWLTLITTIGIAFGTIVPFTALGNSLGMAALPANYFIWLLLTVFAYFLLVSLMKKVYLRRFGELL